MARADRRKTPMTDFLLDRKGSKVNVVIGAELSTTVTRDLQGLLCAAQEDGVTELVLDFSQTKSVDAAGIRLLLATQNSFSGGGKSLTLVHVPATIISLFEALRLNRRLNAHAG